MTTTPQTESQFVYALQQHRSTDFSLLYDAYAPALYGVLLRLVHDSTRAEDLLQDAFIKIWSNSHHYDPTQGRLFTWLLTITRNVAMDDLRAQKVRASAVQHIAATEYCFTSTSEGLIHQSLLSHLAPKHRAIMELIFYRDYTRQEVADELKLPIGTVKTRYRLALQQLRHYFSQDIHQYQLGLYGKPTHSLW